jgi:predicted phosphodiesterase
MRLLVLSDLHLERDEAYALPRSFPEHDVVVLAGDIAGPAALTIAWLRRRENFATGKPILYVAGNHEFYGRVIEDETAWARRVQIESPSRVHFLDADIVPIIDGVRFLGCTLWTDYALHGDVALGMLAAGMGLNDHKRIGIRDPHDGRLRPFKPRDALHRHRLERAWLMSQLAIEHGGPTVVITHHGCAPGSVHPRHLVDRVAGQLNPAFVSDLTEVIDRYQPALWIHGHTHDSRDYMIGGTRVLCNPKGYGPARINSPIENPNFDDQLVIEVPELQPRPMP